MQSIAPAPHHSQNQDMSADNGCSPPSPHLPRSTSPTLLADMMLAPSPDIRAQLVAAGLNLTSPSPQQQQQQQQQQQLPPPPQQPFAHQGPPHGYGDVHHSSSASPHDQNIDPAIGGPSEMNMSSGGHDNDSGGDNGLADGRRGSKRGLAQSKRAAQNRAAQRAFRQRKEGYIKKLEEQVRDMHALEENFKAIQEENYSLREYIIHLQSRLIESQGEYPQPPANVNLHHPREPIPQQPPPPQPRHDGAPMAPMTLQASAARGIAVAGLQSDKHALAASEEQAAYEDGKHFKRGDDEAADEEMRAQLQADGLPL